MALLALARAVASSLIPWCSRDEGGVDVQVCTGEASTLSRGPSEAWRAVVVRARVVVFPTGVAVAAQGGELHHARPKQDDFSGQQSRKHESLAAQRSWFVWGSSSIARAKGRRCCRCRLVPKLCLALLAAEKSPRRQGIYRGGRIPPIRIYLTTNPNICEVP